MDTLSYYTLLLLHGYSTPLFHVLVSLLHGHCYPMCSYHRYTNTLVLWIMVTLNAIITYICITDYIDTLHLYFWYLYHRYMSILHCYYMYLSHGFTCVHALFVSVFLLQWITVLITWIFLYSCYMTISCNPDMVLLLLDIWAVYMWYVELSASGFKPRGHL